MTTDDVLIWQFQLPRPTVSPTDAEVLWAAAASPDLGLYGDSRAAPRDRVKRLAGLGLFAWMDWRRCNWQAGMWGATLTCLGFNTLWEQAGDRHEPGCGNPWGVDGACTGCGALRRLDADAWGGYFDSLVGEDRSMVEGKTRLWCGEHGFLRWEQWQTDKTCRVQPASSEHETNTMRIR